MPEPSSQSTDSPRFAWSFLLLRLPVYLFVALVIYVASIGPMYWYWYESYALHDSHEQAIESPDKVTVFYLPLVYACRKSEAVNDYVNWYVDFWV